MELLVDGRRAYAYTGGKPFDPALPCIVFVPGALNDHNRAGADNPGGYLPMLWMFALLSLAGIVFAELLRRRETGPHGHGLETLKVKGF